MGWPRAPGTASLLEPKHWSPVKINSDGAEGIQVVGASCQVKVVARVEVLGFAAALQAQTMMPSSKEEPNA